MYFFKFLLLVLVLLFSFLSNTNIFVISQATTNAASDLFLTTMPCLPTTSGSRRSVTVEDMTYASPTSTMSVVILIVNTSNCDIIIRNLKVTKVLFEQVVDAGSSITIENVECVHYWSTGGCIHFAKEIELPKFVFIRNVSRTNFKLFEQKFHSSGSSSSVPVLAEEPQLKEFSVIYFGNGIVSDYSSSSKKVSSSYVDISDIYFDNIQVLNYFPYLPTASKTKRQNFQFSVIYAPNGLAMSVQNISISSISMTTCRFNFTNSQNSKISVIDLKRNSFVAVKNVIIKNISLMDIVVKQSDHHRVSTTVCAVDIGLVQLVYSSFVISDSKFDALAIGGVKAAAGSIPKMYFFRQNGVFKEISQLVFLGNSILMSVVQVGAAPLISVSLSGFYFQSNIEEISDYVMFKSNAMRIPAVTSGYYVNIYLISFQYSSGSLGGAHGCYFRKVAKLKIKNNVLQIDKVGGTAQRNGVEIFLVKLSDFDMTKKSSWNNYQKQLPTIQLKNNHLRIGAIVPAGKTQQTDIQISFIFLQNNVKNLSVFDITNSHVSFIPQQEFSQLLATSSAEASKYAATSVRSKMSLLAQLYFSFLPVAIENPVFILNEVVEQIFLIIPSNTMFPTPLIQCYSDIGIYGLSMNNLLSTSSILQQLEFTNIERIVFENSSIDLFSEKNESVGVKSLNGRLMITFAYIPYNYGPHGAITIMGPVCGKIMRGDCIYPTLANTVEFILQNIYVRIRFQFFASEKDSIISTFYSFAEILNVRSILFDNCSLVVGGEKLFRGGTSDRGSGVFSITNFDRIKPTSAAEALGYSNNISLIQKLEVKNCSVEILKDTKIVTAMKSSVLLISCAMQDFGVDNDNNIDGDTFSGGGGIIVLNSKLIASDRATSIQSFVHFSLVNLIGLYRNISVPLIVVANELEVSYAKANSMIRVELLHLSYYIAPSKVHQKADNIVFVIPPAAADVATTTNNNNREKFLNLYTLKKTTRFEVARADLSFSSSQSQTYKKVLEHQHLSETNSHLSKNVSVFVSRNSLTIRIQTPTSNTMEGGWNFIHTYICHEGIFVISENNFQLLAAGQHDDMWRVEHVTSFLRLFSKFVKGISAVSNNNGKIVEKVVATSAEDKNKIPITLLTGNTLFSNVFSFFGENGVRETNSVCTPSTCAYLSFDNTYSQHCYGKIILDRSISYNFQNSSLIYGTNMNSTEIVISNMNDKKDGNSWPTPGAGPVLSLPPIFEDPYKFGNTLWKFLCVDFSNNSLLEDFLTTMYTRSIYFDAAKQLLLLTFDNSLETCMSVDPKTSTSAKTISVSKSVSATKKSLSTSFSESFMRTSTTGMMTSSISKTKNSSQTSTAGILSETSSHEPTANSVSISKNSPSQTQATKSESEILTKTKSLSKSTDRHLPIKILDSPAIESAMSVMLLAGTLASSPGAYVMSQKLLSVAGLALCPRSSTDAYRDYVDDLGFEANPTTMQISSRKSKEFGVDDPFSTYRGSLIGNTVLTVGIILVVYCCCVIAASMLEDINNNEEKENAEDEDEKPSFMEKFVYQRLRWRLPGRLYNIAFLAGVGTSSAIGTVAAIKSTDVISSNTAVDYMLVAIPCLLLICLPLFYFIKIALKFDDAEHLVDIITKKEDENSENKDDDRNKHKKKNKSNRSSRTQGQLESENENISQNNNNNNNNSCFPYLLDPWSAWFESDFVRANGTLFENVSFPKFISIDFICAVVIGISGGAGSLCETTKCCTAAISCSLISAVAHFSALVFLRPHVYLCRFDVAVSSTASGITLLQSILVIMMILQEGSDYLTFIEILTYAGLTVGFLDISVSVGQVLYEYVKNVRRVVVIQGEDGQVIAPSSSGGGGSRNTSPYRNVSPTTSPSSTSSPLLKLRHTSPIIIGSSRNRGNASSSSSSASRQRTSRSKSPTVRSQRNVISSSSSVSPESNKNNYSKPTTTVKKVVRVVKRKPSPNTNNTTNDNNINNKKLGRKAINLSEVEHSYQIFNDNDNNNPMTTNSNENKNNISSLSKIMKDEEMNRFSTPTTSLSMKQQNHRTTTKTKSSKLKNNINNNQQNISETLLLFSPQNNDDGEEEEQPMLVIPSSSSSSQQQQQQQNKNDTFPSPFEVFPSHRFRLEHSREKQQEEEENEGENDENDDDGADIQYENFSQEDLKRLLG